MVRAIPLENDPDSLATEVAPVHQFVALANPGSQREAYPLNMVTARAASSTAPKRAVPKPLGLPSELVRTLIISFCLRPRGTQSLLGSNNKTGRTKPVLKLLPLHG